MECDQNPLPQLSKPSPRPLETWSAPPSTCHKLNIDRSFNQTFGTAGISGIIRDNQGELIQTFACATAAKSPLEAEMQAFLRGIQLCIGLGLTDIIIEGDLFIIWFSLQSNHGFPWNLIHLWRRIISALGKIPRWRAELIRRSTNKMADNLAKLGPLVEILYFLLLPYQFTYHISILLINVCRGGCRGIVELSIRSKILGARWRMMTNPIFMDLLLKTYPFVTLDKADKSLKFNCMMTAFFVTLSFLLQ